MSLSKIIAEFHQKYGQLAFGLLVFLIIWIKVIEPALERNNVDIAEMREITKAQREIGTIGNQTAEALKATADTLNSVTSRLENIAARMERTADRMNGG